MKEDEKRIEKVLSRLLELNIHDFSRIEQLLFSEQPSTKPESGAGVAGGEADVELVEASGEGPLRANDEPRAATAKSSVDQFFAAQSESVPMTFGRDLLGHESANSLDGKGKVELSFLSVQDGGHALIPTGKGPAFQEPLEDAGLSADVPHDVSIPTESLEAPLFGEQPPADVGFSDGFQDNPNKIIISSSYDDLMSPLLVSEDKFLSSLKRLEEKGSAESAVEFGGESAEGLPFTPLSLLGDGDLEAELPALVSDDGPPGADLKAVLPIEEPVDGGVDGGSSALVEGPAQESVSAGDGRAPVTENKDSGAVFGRAANPLSFDQIPSSTDDLGRSLKMEERRRVMRAHEGQQTQGGMRARSSARFGAHSRVPIATSEEARQRERHRKGMVPVVRHPETPREETVSGVEFSSSVQRISSFSSSSSFAEVGGVSSGRGGEEQGHDGREGTGGFRQVGQYAPSSNSHLQATPFVPRVEAGVQSVSSGSLSSLSFQSVNSTQAGPQMTGSFPVVHTGMYQLVDGVPQPIYTTTAPPTQWPTGVGEARPEASRQWAFWSAGVLVFLAVLLGVIWLGWFYDPLYRVGSRSVEGKRLSSARVQVVTFPAGAVIFLDDIAMGKKTPATLRLAPGTYTLTLRKKDFLPRTLKVKVGEEKQLLYRLDLRPEKAAAGLKAEGLLYVTASVRRGVVWVDGKPTPSTVPKMLRLAPGPHFVFIRKRRYQSDKHLLQLSPGQFVHLHFPRKEPARILLKRP